MAVIRAFLALLLFVQSGYACYPHPNLMLCWDMEEGTGLRVKDGAGSPFSLDGIMTGSVAWAASTKPRAIVYSNASGSATFVNSGDWTVSFPGTSGADVRSVATPNYNYAGSKPFVMAVTVQLETLRSATQASFVSCAAAGMGWALYKDNVDSLNYYVLGVVGNDFAYKILDTNPHRYLLARNPARDVYLFVDGVLWSVNFLATGDQLNVSDNPLAVGGDQIGLGEINAKINHLAFYNFNWKLDELKVFARNEYLYWQGLKTPEDEIESMGGQ